MVETFKLTHNIMFKDYIFFLFFLQFLVTFKKKKNKLSIVISKILVKNINQSTYSRIQEFEDSRIQEFYNSRIGGGGAWRNKNKQNLIVPTIWSNNKILNQENPSHLYRGVRKILPHRAKNFVFPSFLE